MIPCDQWPRLERGALRDRMRRGNNGDRDEGSRYDVGMGELAMDDGDKRASEQRPGAQVSASEGEGERSTDRCSRRSTPRIVVVCAERSDCQCSLVCLLLGDSWGALVGSRAVARRAIPGW